MNEPNISAGRGGELAEKHFENNLIYMSLFYSIVRKETGAAVLEHSYPN